VIAQELVAALNQGHTGADTVEELRKLAGDDAATQYNHAFRDKVEIQHVVAVPSLYFSESRKGGRAYLRAGGDQDVAGA
jgi:hypothetical protein